MERKLLCILLVLSPNVKWHVILTALDAIRKSFKTLGISGTLRPVTFKAGADKTATLSVLAYLADATDRTIDRVPGLITA